MYFVETRGNDGIRDKKINFSDAILNPSASFGGLYVPESLPKLDSDFLKKHIDSNYKELATDLLNSFEIDIEPSVIKEALDRYDGFDDPTNPIPVVKIEDDCFVSELYHGQTRAFKDMALQPFGYMLSRLAQDRDEKYLIMAATSGDTGPATLETFKNQPNIKVACLYPDGGTSDVQRLQMVTEDAPNLKVIGVKGNFDDTQNSLKSLLASQEFRDELKSRDIKLSAANSVNFGRIIFQIIYHIHSYLELVRKGEITIGDPIYITVPSGNFGNALGGYYAKKAGLPIEKILIASNINNILSDWISTGEYDLRDRELVLTQSPAMDILKSSNIERVMYDKFGATRTKELFESLDSVGRFTLTSDELALLQEDFVATYSDDSEGEKVIAHYAKEGYIMDPHTATCIKAYRELREKKLPTIIYSTAEWTKFSTTVSKALGHDVQSDLEALKWVSENLNIAVPDMINELFDKDIKHKIIVETTDIKEEMLKFL
ncbi:Threonine synthase [hydrothermal vent metagenome]|uniref:threonine synthase n=1 Tax=hydrothermal vent metagenome TaxID=652676 RepID=A0A1W1BDG0_9ZZZZ